MKSQFLKTIKEAALILLIASGSGLIVNLFHPKGVKITIRRPSLQFAADTILAWDLPDVSVRTDEAAALETQNEKTEPLLITTPQLIQLKQSEQVLIFDARSTTEFNQAHIPGAFNLPVKDFNQYRMKVDSLPNDIWLVSYCDDPSCNQAELLAHELIIAGYDLVAVYFEGLNGWIKSVNEIAVKEANNHAP